MLKKLACFTGWLLVLCVSLMFCFTLGLWQNWSTPTILLFWLLMLLLATLLWCSLHALLLGINRNKGRHWLKKYRLSRREYVLLNHWKTGANVIKRIWRRGTRLPWYLLVGERCGKSTLLAGAGLPRFYGDADDAVVGATRTLRWWFFRDIGILDLSSNFLSGAKSFRQSWGKLAHWCTRLPAPAGIIIALPMSELMSQDFSALHATARRQRAMIEPLLKRFGERLPLYVIVTQCDCFPGFSLWQQQLSAQQCQQPLGYIWPTPPHIDGQDEQPLQPLFAALQQGFSQVRLSMARPASLSEHDYATLLDFPEAFARLEPALRYVLASLCEPNVWFSHNSLGSVWFCTTAPQVENRGRRVSLFVHNLLTRHLPELSQHRGGQCWYQRPRGKAFCLFAAAICTMWLIVSASLSAGRLRADIAQLQPDALAQFLAQDEQRTTTDLRYLPFLPLLNHQYRQAESRLARIADTSQQDRLKLMDLQQRALVATPEQQRETILQMAHALLIWQQMREGIPLNALKHSAPVIDSLKQHTYSDKLSPLAKLALERYYMQRPDGERWRQSVQRLLVTLVNHDPDLVWLTASSSELPPLQAASFWPLLPKRVALSGVWTREGQTTLSAWMSLIERAVGQPQPIFLQAKERWPMARQDAWQHYLTDVTASLSSAEPEVMPGSQLISLAQNQSQAMQFVARTVDELSDIPDSQAQPWLMTLRQLQQLAIKSDASTLLRRAAHVDNRMRQTLTAWLQGAPEREAVNESAIEDAWRQWQNARNSAVKEAVAQAKPSDRLVRGLFAAPTDGANRNTLADLFPALTALQERLSPDNKDAGVAAVWLLYQADARQLLANALAQSACWLNAQWKSAVIWPLGKDAEQRSYEDQQALSQQLVDDFLKRSARMLLVAGNNGPAAAEYAGMAVPLTADFLRLTRRSFSAEIMQDLPQRASTRESDQLASLQAKAAALELQQSALEKKEVRITVASLPATVPGGAQVIPTGTQLSLHCQKGEQQLTSMNFAEKALFSWQPGQCDSITLSVMFPDFTASYHLDGDDAWPVFINHITSGEMLLDSNDFDDSAVLLNHLGIKQLLVRFTVSDSQALAETWQNWVSRAEQINDLYHQIARIEERLAFQQRDDSLIPPLSALPGDIAQCK